ncbi:MAG TPA: glycosyltransferase family 39 protein [Candidatus Binatia bacterium]|jgi:4-amino-4-deoxy-L-arabinose transferase-like glycosyltransferase
MSKPPAEPKSRAWIVGVAALAVLCWFVLFNDLGGPALVEPDEGRNAEVAREILLLGDWVTPHYDFIPYLDKPMFFFWLAAGAYKLFGISEFSARLPAALAALGCVLLVYDFGRRFVGPWSALWSALVLVTCPMVMAFSRAVIFDMPLAFFITLALWAFARGKTADANAAGKFYLVMYAAAAAAALTKGPIGLAVPALVIGPYLLVRRKPTLRAIKPLLGAALFLLIAAPWYLWAEARNPDYLRYFFIEENFLRYLTPRFNRGQPWYFYFEVLAVGFLPWTTLLQLPFTRAAALKDADRLFIVLWAVVPFFFFSFSAAKQPGYILPAFPPLALLTGTAIASVLQSAAPRTRRPLAVPWIVLLIPMGYFAAALFFPSLLPPGATDVISPFLTQPTWLFIPTVFLLLLVVTGASLWASPPKYYVASCIAFCALHLFASGIFDRISNKRSSKELAEKVMPLIRPGDQVVVYSNYMSSLPFYLRAEKPLWVVVSDGGGAVMGSFYMAEKKPRPARGSGDAVMSFDKFAEVWDHSPARLFVFVEEKKLPKLAANVGREPKRLSTVDEIALVTNQ